MLCGAFAWLCGVSVSRSALDLSPSSPSREPIVFVLFFVVVCVIFFFFVVMGKEGGRTGVRAIFAGLLCRRGEERTGGTRNENDK